MVSITHAKSKAPPKSAFPPAANPFKPEPLKQSEPDPEEEKRLACQAKGGIWNSAKQLCDIPKEVMDKRLADKNNKPGFQAFQDADTGKLSGVQVNDQTFLGLGPRDVARISATQGAERELPIGGQADLAIQRQEEQRQQFQTEGVELAGQVGATPSEDVLAQLQGTISNQNLDFIGPLFAATPGIIPDVIGGALTGFGAGALIGSPGGPLGSVATGSSFAVYGAIANGVRGFYGDYVSDLKSQQSALVESTIRSLSETKPKMTELINSANANPQDASTILEDYNTNREALLLEYQRLKDLTDGNLDEFLGENGINQETEWEVYYQVGGEADGFDDNMRLALANPDPARIRPTSITQEDLKKRIAKELS